jgi:hypothetical protein
MAVSHTDSAKEMSLINEKGRFQGHVQKRLQECLTSTAVVFPDPLHHTVSASSVIKTPGNTEEDPHDPEPADERDIQEYSSDQSYSISIGAVTKSHL